MYALVLGVRRSEEGNSNRTTRKDFIRKSLLDIE